MLRPNISNEDYHADPALGSSRARNLLGSCPLKVKHSMAQPSPSTPALRNGSLIHTAALEPALVDVEFGCKPSEIDGNSSRTKAYKDAIAEMEAAEPNKRWLPEADYNMCMEVAASARQHPLLMEMLYHPASKVEHTGFFEVEGTPCKVRPDLYNSETGMVLDLKTTLDASEKGFAKSVRQFGYAFQAAFYMTGLRAMGERPKQFVFLVVEKSEPYATACYALDNNDIEKEIPRVLESIKLYGECLRTDVWPGYTDDIKTLNLGGLFTTNRLSITQIADKFRVSRSFVCKVVKKHKLEQRKVGNRNMVDMTEFSTALRWENERKSA